MSDKFKYTVGLNNVGSYQVAGSPYVTASTVSQGTEQEIQFPRVTNNVTVKLNSAGSPITYNSLFLSGQVAFTSSIDFSGGDLTPTSSFSFSWWGLQITSSGDTDDYLMGFGPSNSQANGLRVQFNNRIIFKSSNSSTSTEFVASIPGDEQWHHYVFTLESNAAGAHHTASLYVDGAPFGGGVNNPSVTNTPSLELNAFGDTFFIGGTHAKEPEHKYRDVILWDGVLTTGQVNALYQASGSYSNSGFSPAGLRKIIWVKPTEGIQTQINSLSNSGDGGDSSLSRDLVSATNYDIVADAPFTDTSGGGELRIHYRSTGSLPNVANNKHYWTLSSQYEKIKMNVKTKEIYLSAVDGDCDYCLYADLTNIPASRMYQHTGSGVDE